MKLYLIPFNAEAKILTSILPNCKKASNLIFQNRWEYKNGEIISWNESGINAIKKVIEKIENFDKYSSVILFGSAGSLAPNLNIGEIYSCNIIKDTENNSWQISTFNGLRPNSVLTAKEPIFDNDLRMKYYQKYHCNLIDMEASIFAQLSIEGFFKNAETYIIRFISDNYDTLSPSNKPNNIYTKQLLLKTNSEIVKYRKLLI